MIDVRTNAKLIKHFQKLLIQEKRRIEKLDHIPLPSDLQKSIFLEKTLAVIEIHSTQSPDHPKRLAYRFVRPWDGKMVKSMGTVVKHLHWRTSSAPRWDIPESYIARIWKGFTIPQREKVTKASLEITRGIGGIYAWRVDFGY